MNGACELINSCAIKAIYLECDFNNDDPQHTFFHDIFNYLTARSFAFHGLFEVIHYSRNYGIGYCNALFINRNIILLILLKHLFLPQGLTSISLSLHCHSFFRYVKNQK